MVVCKDGFDMRFMIKTVPRGHYFVVLSDFGHNDSQLFTYMLLYLVILII